MKSIHILLVEDNEGDILLIKEAFEERKVINKISVVKDGEKAISFLNQEEEFTDAPVPDLIILDVNLPGKSGHEVLTHIKERNSLKHIPVIMLASSSSEQDIMQSYKNHANCYITKPVNVDEFLKAVVEIEQFWISIVKLPLKV